MEGVALLCSASSAAWLLTDYRSGTLGRISLETPATRQAMLDAARSKAKLDAARRKAELDAARNQAALDAEHNKATPSMNDDPDAVE